MKYRLRLCAVFLYFNVEHWPDCFSSFLPLLPLICYCCYLRRYRPKLPPMLDFQYLLQRSKVFCVQSIFNYLYYNMFRMLYFFNRGEKSYLIWTFVITIQACWRICLQKLYSKLRKDINLQNDIHTIRWTFLTFDTFF